MNINVGTATGYLQVNADGIRQGVQQADSYLTGLDATVLNSWWGLRNIGLAAAAAGGAIGGAFIYAAKTAVEWEEAMAGVIRTNWLSNDSIEANIASMQRLEKELFDVARNRPTPTIEIANIAELAGSLGVAKDDVAEFTGVVADLSATTDLTADKAGTDLARIAALTGVAGGQFKNLASSILETGRSTAATETDITGLAQRIAPIASIVGLSASEVIGFSAAIRSAGIQSQEGGTAFQKTFLDMQRAVNGGGEELRVFAQIAGMSADEFSTSFGQDAAGTMLAFISGLGEMGQQGLNVVGALDAIEITEARQVKTLLALAQAQSQNVNENLKLSNVLDIANRSFEEGNALQEITSRQYATVSAQVQILKNQIFELANMVGKVFLPPLQLLNKILQYTIQGFMALSGPARTMMLVMFAIEGAILAFVAAIALVLPRIVLMNNTLKQLEGRALTAATAQGALTGSTLQLGAAQGAASASGLRLASTLRGAGATAGKLGAFLGIATVAMTLFGFATADSKDKTDELADSNQGLVDAIRTQSQGLGTAADEWIAYALNAAGVIPILQDLGFNLAQLLALIKGSSDAQLASSFASVANSDDLTKQQQEAVQSIIDLREEYKESAATAATFSAALDDQTGSTEDSTAATQQNTEALRKQQEAARRQYQETEKVNSAILDYVSAQAQAEGAALDQVDAWESYQEAARKAANAAKYIQMAELELQQARLKQQLTTFKLKDAEYELSVARRNAAFDLADAEASYADAQDGLYNANQRVKEAEEALARLRNGPTTEELIKATNKLVEAQIRLKGANMDVADAEWYLQHLREEGAGARDIERATLALEESQSEAAQAAENLSEAQAELNDLQTVTPEELKEAQMELAAAIREVEAAERNLIQLQEEIARKRQDIANDRAYKEALAALLGVRIEELQSIFDVHDAEAELLALRNGKLQRDAQRAQLDYRDAVMSVAQANTDLIVSQLEMQGQFVSTGRKAQILAGQIGSLLNTVPDQATFDKLAEWQGILSGATDPGRPPEMGDAGSGAGDFGWSAAADGWNEGYEDFLDQTDPTNHTGAGLEWKKDWTNWLISGVAGIAAGVLTGNPMIGVMVAGLVSQLLDTSGLDQKITDWVNTTFKPWINDNIIQPVKDFFSNNEWARDILNLNPLKILFDIFTGNFDSRQIQQSFLNLVGDVIGFIDEIPGLILQGIQQIPILGSIVDFWFADDEGKIDLSFSRIVSTVLTWGQAIVSTLMGAVGFLPRLVLEQLNKLPELLRGIATIIKPILPDAVRQFIDQAINKFEEFIRWLTAAPGNAFAALAGISETLKDRGRALMTGFLNGAREMWNDIYAFIVGLPGRILYDAQQFLNTNTLFQVGRAILTGLLNGMKDIDVLGWLGGLKDDFVGTLQNVFGINSPSKVMRKEVGQYLTMGIASGIEDRTKDAVTAARNAAMAIMGGFEDSIDPAELLALSRSSLQSAAMRNNPDLVSAGVGGSGNVTHGDTINIQTLEPLTAEQLANEIAWKKRVRSRGAKK